MLVFTAWNLLPGINRRESMYHLIDTKGRELSSIRVCKSTMLVGSVYVQFIPG